MQSRIIDPIFQKKEYYCVICEQASRISLLKHKERKQRDMIRQEIQRLWDFHLNERQNYEKFCRYSKIKLTYKKYHQFVLDSS